MDKISQTEVLLEIRKRAKIKKSTRIDWLYDLALIALAIAAIIPIWKTVQETGNVTVAQLLSFICIPLAVMIISAIFRGRWPVRKITPEEFNKEFNVYKKECEEKIRFAEEAIQANKEILDALIAIEPHL